MSGAANAHCPRCGESFRCGAHDPTPCACLQVTLGAETTRALLDRYQGCLCLRCLTELASPPDAGEKKPAQP